MLNGLKKRWWVVRTNTVLDTEWAVGGPYRAGKAIATRDRLNGLFGHIHGRLYVVRLKEDLPDAS